jgi:hypothetical protein
MTALRAALAVPIDRAERYRAEGLWGGRKLADGIEAAAGRRSRALALADNDSRFTYDEGWYRTGDLVEMNGGRLTVIGRLEEVVTAAASRSRSLRSTPRWPDCAARASTRASPRPTRRPANISLSRCCPKRAPR